MRKLSYSEIHNIINSDLFYENDMGPEAYFNDDFADANEIEESSYSEEFVNQVKLLGTVVEKAQYGGEGKGDDYWVVYEFVDHGVYVKFDGWYASHAGSEYEEMFEVFPAKVEVIEWVPTC